MDIERADYSTIIKFGTLDDLKKKMEIESQHLSNIVDNTDDNGISLLQRALISRKFDIAQYLLNEGAKVNIIPKEGFNELHYLAANINFVDAIQVARLLINCGVDLNHVDIKYGNTALLSICLEILKRQTKEGLDFIEEIIKEIADIDIANKSGKSVRSLLNERGTDKIRALLREK